MSLCLIYLSQTFNVLIAVYTCILFLEKRGHFYVTLHHSDQIFRILTLPDLETMAQQHAFFDHYTDLSPLAGTASLELEDFVKAKFYCPHALADSNWHISIMEKIQGNGFQYSLLCVGP